ncbi:hypothetical protein A1O3_08992 [Capronia epimyces CBS 606.96]|uniref:Major facilitator superfamily (MFS) profile domain-containing protein n=1 Tax=Capronia epimyces CBS 606.96 TaxID=1182542 RepID=W9XCA9_9EURO|nr:uncharacterized protein A1O3_08992 [Capronia epimyces CBS 606.96]EXJ77833.1 hypothetical protein A1O3_08992 [Capronia epimyces CBS 606.96]
MASFTPAVDSKTAQETRKQADAVISRGVDTTTLRDDPEAKAAFLATFTAEEEKKIMRKVDQHFFLLIGLMFLIKTVDFTNAANVKVLQVGQESNILKELHMTPNQYNWVQSIYYIAYIIFETPSNLMLKWIGPHRWQSRIFLTWGIVLACHAAVKNRASLLALRFLLGMMEAGLFPGVICQLTSWYRTEEMGNPTSFSQAVQGTASIVGSLLAYGISYMNGKGGMSAWRWVFLLEGLFTIVFSGFVWYFLPDYPKSPRSDKWLTKREQEFIETRLTENTPLTSDPLFSKKEVIAALKAPTTWSFGFSHLFVNMGGYSLTWYLPTILTDLGFAKLPKNQLLNIPPAAGSIIGVLLAAFLLRQALMPRPALLMINFVGMVVCFVLFFTIDSRGGLYAACILGQFFYQGSFMPFWAWRSITLKGSTGAALSLAIQNSMGQVGGVVGPQLFQSKWAYNRYKTSFAIAASGIIAAVFTNLLSWWLTKDLEMDVLRIAKLKRKARKEGTVFAADDVKVFDQRKYDSVVRLKSKNAHGEAVLAPTV